mgnify:CR=1 FL=1
MSKAIRSSYLLKRITFATSQDCLNKVLVTAPHLNPTHVVHLPPPLLHAQAHEKAAMHTTREPMRMVVESKDCPKVRAW